jgi:hypothetical protein
MFIAKTMLPIREINFGEDEELDDGVIVIFSHRGNTGSSLLHLKIRNLLINECFYNNESKDMVICFDISDNNSEIRISFDSILTVQEVAEELSLKFGYNVDRIRTAITNDDYSIALVPKSKRAV